MMLNSIFPLPHVVDPLPGALLYIVLDGVQALRETDRMHLVQHVSPGFGLLLVLETTYQSEYAHIEYTNTISTCYWFPGTTWDLGLCGNDTCD